MRTWVSDRERVSTHLDYDQRAAPLELETEEKAKCLLRWNLPLPWTPSDSSLKALPLHLLQTSCRQPDFPLCSAQRLPAANRQVVSCDEIHVNSGKGQEDSMCTQYLLFETSNYQMLICTDKCWGKVLDPWKGQKFTFLRTMLLFICSSTWRILLSQGIFWDDIPEGAPDLLFLLWDHPYELGPAYFSAQHPSSAQLKCEKPSKGRQSCREYLTKNNTREIILIREVDLFSKLCLASLHSCGLGLSRRGSGSRGLCLSKCSIKHILLILQSLVNETCWQVFVLCQRLIEPAPRAFAPFNHANSFCLSYLLQYGKMKMKRYTFLQRSKQGSSFKANAIAFEMEYTCLISTCTLLLQCRSIPMMSRCSAMGGLTWLKGSYSLP